MIHFFELFLISEVESKSEIHLIIKGKGNQIILNEMFYYKPDEVIINGAFNNTCKNTCELKKEINEITLIFNEEIRSCENMFYNLINIKEVDLSKFDASKVTKMNSMFHDCKMLKKITFGNINTSSVEDMSSLFQFCNNLNSVDLSDFDASCVTAMEKMFSNCNSLKSIDATSFVTTKVENMLDLFGYCTNLIWVNLSSFYTKNVKTMKGMFIDCVNLKYLDLQNFGASSLDNLNYMFKGCESLIYLNLKLFKLKQFLSAGDTFFGLDTKLKYCIVDTNTKEILLGDKISNCSDICFQENIKIDNEKKECVKYCDNSTFEYNNICFKHCPDETKKMLANRNVCTTNIPENFYFDINSEIYKECYQTCKICSIAGNDENNNCDECKSNYTFINDSSIPNKNCFPKCEFYYYFNKEKNYICTKNKSCPKDFNKLIMEKNKCIDDCRKDENNRFEYNNTCLEKCPNGTIYNNITNICEEIEKNIDSTILYQDKENKLSNEDELLINFQENITSRKFDDIIKNITESKKDYLLKKDNIMYQITTSENQNINKNNEISNIDLLGCENILREKYEINETLPLIILKIDLKLNYTLIPFIGYEIYHPINKTKLDLTYCNDSILVRVPASVNENKLFINVPNSDDYNDKCFAYTTENGTDIILNDRKQEFIDNNLSLYENNCSYINYDKKTKQSSCYCYIKNKIDLISEMIKNPNKLNNNISNEQSDSNSLNIMTMKYTKELFSKEGLKNNISSYIILIIIFFFLLSIIYFIKCGYYLLEEKIRKIINLHGKNKKYPNIFERNNINKNQTQKREKFYVLLKKE